MFPPSGLSFSRLIFVRYLDIRHSPSFANVGGRQIGQKRPENITTTAKITFAPSTKRFLAGKCVLTRRIYIGYVAYLAIANLANVGGPEMGQNRSENKIPTGKRTLNIVTKCSLNRVNVPPRRICVGYLAYLALANATNLRQRWRAPK